MVDSNATESGNRLDRAHWLGGWQPRFLSSTCGYAAGRHHFHGDRSRCLLDGLERANVVCVANSGWGPDAARSGLGRRFAVSAGIAPSQRIAHGIRVLFVAANG